MSQQQRLARKEHLSRELAFFYEDSFLAKQRLREEEALWRMSAENDYDRPTKRTFTESDANQLARALKQACSDALDIEVFGSVARNGSGNDIDMIICVPEELSWRFFGYVRSGNMFEYENSARLRLSVAFDLLTEDDGLGSPFLDVLGDDFDGALDVFLFPQNWRCRLYELQHELPHKDPNFMSNVARDARVIA